MVAIATQFDLLHATGEQATEEQPMNTLQMIKERQQKRQRLSDAQRLMAKAYRGVDYVDAHHSRPEPKRASDLTYRGIRYSV